MMKIKTTLWEEEDWQRKVVNLIWLMGAMSAPIVIICIKDKAWGAAAFAIMQLVCVFMIIISHNKWKQEGKDDKRRKGRNRTKTKPSEETKEDVQDIQRTDTKEEESGELQRTMHDTAKKGSKRRVL